MSAIDRELLERLAPEYQEAFALLELQKAKRRHTLLEQLRGFRKWESILLRLSGVLPIVAMLLGYKFAEKSSESYFIGILFTLIFMGEAKIFFLDRKMNALIELLEEDLKKKV